MLTSASAEDIARWEAEKARRDAATSDEHLREVLGSLIELSETVYVDAHGQARIAQDEKQAAAITILRSLIAEAR